MTKLKEKQLAIQLRKEGFTYSEILQKVSVTKSTLSRWLKSVNLAKVQKQRITEKRKQARLKAIKVIRQKRLIKTQKLIKSGVKEVKALNNKDLFIIGVSLYWAEGAKQKPNNVSQRVSFSNSDPEMIKIFLLWLKKICKINSKRLVFEIYLHQTVRDNQKLIEKILNHWRKILKIPRNKKINLRFKRSKLKKTNTLDNYFGVFRIEVRKSTDFNRKITGWIRGIVKNLKDGE